MNKEYLKRFIDANEKLTLQSIDDLRGVSQSKEEFDAKIKLYSEVSRQQLAAIKQLNDVENEEELTVIEYEKINVANENFIAQQKQELQIEVMNSTRELVMQLLSMGFYTARFREGLRFDIDNFVNDGFVRSLVQKLPDFIKSRK